jgi:hypothetical protein
VVLDSGTSLVTGPRRDVLSLISSMPFREDDAEGGGQGAGHHRTIDSDDCQAIMHNTRDNLQFPNITFDLSGHRLTLTPQDYLIMVRRFCVLFVCLFPLFPRLSLLMLCIAM